MTIMIARLGRYVAIINAMMDVLIADVATMHVVYQKITLTPVNVLMNYKVIHIKNVYDVS